MDGDKNRTQRSEEDPAADFLAREQQVLGDIRADVLLEQNATSTTKEGVGSNKDNPSEIAKPLNLQEFSSGVDLRIEEALTVERIPFISGDLKSPTDSSATLATAENQRLCSNETNEQSSAIFAKGEHANAGQKSLNNNYDTCATPDERHSSAVNFSESNPFICGSAKLVGSNFVVTIPSPQLHVSPESPNGNFATFPNCEDHNLNAINVKQENPFVCGAPNSVCTTYGAWPTGVGLDAVNSNTKVYEQSFNGNFATFPNDDKFNSDTDNVKEATPSFCNVPVAVALFPVVQPSEAMQCGSRQTGQQCFNGNFAIFPPIDQLNSAERITKNGNPFTDAHGGEQKHHDKCSPIATDDVKLPNNSVDSKEFLHGDSKDISHLISFESPMTSDISLFASETLSDSETTASSTGILNTFAIGENQPIDDGNAKSTSSLISVSVDTLTSSAESQSQAGQSNELISFSRIESEKLRKWRIENERQLEEKDREEERQKEELCRQARKDLEDMTKQSTDSVARIKTQNQENDPENPSSAEPSDNIWERVVSMCDFSSTAKKSPKDTSRLRSIYLQLKQNSINKID